MTKDNEFKAIVRERMSVTGGTYTAPQRAILDLVRHEGVPLPPKLPRIAASFQRRR
jgi:hypothetical protein